MQQACVIPVPCLTPSNSQVSLSINHNPQDSRATPEEMFEEEQMQGSVMLVLQELDEREAGIIRMRLGIDGSEVYTLEDIGRT